MPFTTTYTRTKTFANGGTLLPADLNNIQDDLGNKISDINNHINDNVTTEGGFSDSSTVRRGASIVATEQATTSATYTLLTTPDRVSSIVLPTDGLIFILYHASWKESVAGAGNAAIFLGSNQLKVAPGIGGAAAVQETLHVRPTAINQYNIVGTMPEGLSSYRAPNSYTQTGDSTVSSVAPTAYTGDVTTGQLAGGASVGMWDSNSDSDESSTRITQRSAGGPCSVFAAAGTYDISVRFKTSSGTVTVKERKLWVWTVGF